MFFLRSPERSGCRDPIITNEARGSDITALQHSLCGNEKATHLFSVYPVLGPGPRNFSCLGRPVIPAPPPPPPSARAFCTNRPVGESPAHPYFRAPLFTVAVIKRLAEGKCHKVGRPFLSVLSLLETGFRGGRPAGCDSFLPQVAVCPAVLTLGDFRQLLGGIPVLV